MKRGERLALNVVDRTPREDVKWEMMHVLKFDKHHTEMPYYDRLQHAAHDGWEPFQETSMGMWFRRRLQ